MSPFVVDRYIVSMPTLSGKDIFEASGVVDKD